MFEALILAAFVLFIIIMFVVVGYRYLSRRPNKRMFESKWKEIYSYCRTKETWPLALDRADRLLEAALKSRRYRGKNMGERLVAAQKTLSDNDGIWLAHKLTVKLREHPKARVSEKRVKQSLLSIYQGLKDLDVL